MVLSREEIVNKLLKGYQTYYNIERNEDPDNYLAARCDYYEHAEKYVMSRKAELWSADSEEFLYLFNVPHLTPEIYERCKSFAYEDGMGRANIGPGHMYSYITAVIISDQADEDAVKALRKSRIHKSFHFSLHGWMDYRAALVVTEGGGISTNGAGRCVAKILKKVLK